MGRTSAELGEIIKARRLALGRKQIDVVNAARAIFDSPVISEPTYRAMETGRTNASDLKLSVVSRALDWPHDALARIREGADPDSIENTGAVLGDLAPAFSKTLRTLSEAELRSVRQIVDDLLSGEP